MTTGELIIRGSEEPVALPSPTTMTGTNDAGTLTAGNLSTPAISFTRHITDPADTDVDIDASFSQLAPGSLAGNVDEDGHVTLSAQLRVDLHIEVEILEPEYDCTTAPVSLTLEGQHTGPEGSPADTVVLADEDFTVPPTTVTATCPDFIAENINEQLAGSGHSLTMTMAGHLTRAIDPGDPSVTTLAISTAGPIEQGDEVTLTATVAPAPDVEETSVPAGSVTFLDGSQVLGDVPLDGTGTAVLSTTAILAGARPLRARYEGSPPLYAASTSAPTTLQVFALPIVAVDLPPALRTGSTADFGVEATNTGFGRDITNARLDVTIQRAGGSASIANPRITLSSLIGGTPTAIPLTQSGSGAAMRLRGSIGDLAGAPLAPGDSLSAQLRLGAAANTALVGGLRVTVALVEVGSGGVATGTVAEGTDDMALASAERADATISAGQAAIPDFGIPETPAVLPTQVRAGNVVTLSFFQVVGSGAAGPVTGTNTFSIAGRPVLARNTDAASTEWTASLPATVRPEILVPRDIGAGPHTLTVTYSGDTHHRPASASFPMSVVGPIGPSYDCLGGGTFPGAFRAQLEGWATLPAVARAGDVDLDNLALRLHLARGGRSLQLFDEVSGNPERAIDLTVGPEGTGEAADITEVNDTEMLDDTGPVDHSVILQAPTGRAVIAGDPGESVLVTLASLTFSYIESFLGARNTIVCSPADGPLVLGTVMVAGTSVVATPVVVGLGEDVILRATSLPAAGGTVEFRDGATTIGVVPTVDGTATLITSELPAGTAKVTGIFRSSTGAVPTTVSEPIDVRVVAACPEAVEEGNGAVVRLVYMELLGRCPDPVGFAYWVSRLEGGTTPAALARAIARTPEAVGRVVDDAYETMLERAPDAVGRAFWTKRLQASGRYDQLLADLAGSGEFWSKAGATNTGFVTRVYDRLLGRVPDAGGLAYWTGRLAAGTSRRTLVLTLANLDEPLGRLVAGSYGEILDRAPDVTERSDGIAHLRTTGDRSGLYAGLIGRDEFATRAQTFPEA